MVFDRWATVFQAIPTLIELMKDPSVVVRDTTAWTVGRICELLPEAAINDVYLPPLLQCLIEGLGAEPRVASNVCWVSLDYWLVASGLWSKLASEMIVWMAGHMTLCSARPGLFLPGGCRLRGHGCCRGPG